MTGAPAPLASLVAEAIDRGGPGPVAREPGPHRAPPARAAEEAGAPDASPILHLLRQLHGAYLPYRDGAVATYIPELAKVEPDRFGIALVTADGHVYEVGDSRHPFTIQSISKPFIYGLALQDCGRDAVLKRIGVEPSGEPFNAIEFDEVNNRPFNPMQNAGAIAATALIRGADAGQRMARILDLFRTLAGRAVGIDEAVYRSEAATGHRNRAIAYLELNNGMIDGDVDTHLDLYFRQCSIVATATDIAFMGATLANGGVHPVTGERALAGEHVRDVLSVMTSCGMYDYAGEWEFRIGLPAKSGVGGGIMAVLPGQLAIGVFSPRVDPRGNSSRGIRVCEELARRLQLHLLDHRGSARSALRRVYRGADIRSKRIRNAETSELLDAEGGAICIFELQGDLHFGNTEQVVRRVLDETIARHIILDLARVATADAVAAGLLRQVSERLTQAGRTVCFAGAPRELQSRLGVQDGIAFAEADAALEHCEDRLLGGAPGGVPAFPRLDQFELLEELDAAEMAILERHLVPKTYVAGQLIIAEGSVADSLYFLLDGSVDIRTARADDGTATRLATVDAGNGFGELALLGARPRTADAVAASAVAVLKLKATRFAALSKNHPAIRAKLLVAVGRSLSVRLHRANAAIRALTR